MGGGKEEESAADQHYGPLMAAVTGAAQASAGVAREQLAWAREQYWADREVTDLVIEQALDRMDFNDANAEKDRARYEEIFQPLEDDLAADAADYDTQSRRDANAGAAMATVSQQFSGAREAAQDRLEEFGVDPSQTRSQALDVGMRTAEAAARAAAGTQSYQNTENTGRALRSEAINVGSQAMGTPVQWADNSVKAWGVAENAMSARYKADQSESSGGSGMGSILGIIGGLAGKFEEGGAVPEFDEMGQLPPPPSEHQGASVDESMSPSQGAIPDDVPARLNAGEFVLPKDVVAWYGEEKLQKLIQKAREGKEGAAAKPKMGAIPAGEAPAVNTTGRQ
jgi:hypothetical protein